MTGKNILDGVNPKVVAALNGTPVRMLLKASTVPSGRTAVSVILGDSDGMVHLILPGNCLLDIVAVSKSMDRKLAMIEDSSASAILDKLGLDDIPAIPGILDMPVVVDSAIPGMQVVCITSGKDGAMIGMDQGNFNALLTDVKQATFSVPMAEITSRINGGDDLTIINAAVVKFTTRQIQKTLENTLDVPPLSETTRKLISLSSDPDAGGRELASIVEADPSLSAQVVSWASSSFYSAPGSVKSVHDAVNRVLGFDLVMNLSMGLTMGKALQLPTDQPNGYTPYWRQAMWMACAMDALVKAIPTTHRPSQGLAYLSGLLHNFGYLVLAHVFPQRFSLVCRYTEVNPNIDSSIIDRFILEVSREQLGSKLMQMWNMPEEISTAVRHQKKDNYSGDNFAYANLLYIARNLLCEYGAITGTSHGISDELYARLHLDPIDASLAIKELMEEEEEITNMTELLK